MAIVIVLEHGQPIQVPSACQVTYTRFADTNTIGIQCLDPAGKLVADFNATKVIGWFFVEPAENGVTAPAEIHGHQHPSG